MQTRYLSYLCISNQFVNMKTMKWLAALAVVLAAVSCGPKKEAPKVLVLYYSQSGNTKVLAETIAASLKADIEAIEAEVPYDGSYQETIARSRQEREQNILPACKPLAADLSKYDVIFLGYPIWFGTYALPVASWLNEVDLSGKKLVPFCTFGSGGLDASVKDLTAKQPGATVLPGYGVRAARMDAVPAEVDQFLKAGGFLKGKYVKLDEFPEQKPVTEEEAAIFAASIQDYPMMAGAKAATVASRTIPGGTEYLFTAVPRPRGNDSAPDQRIPDMKVYVTVLEGEAPVFTQVVR